MKKLLTFINLLFLLLIFSCGNANEARFHLAETGEVTTDVYTVKGKIANFYLVKYSADKYFAIDAGDDDKLLTKGVNKLNIDPLDVTHIFMTHSDYDHRAYIDEMSNGEVYLSEEEVCMFDGSQRRFGPVKNKDFKNGYTTLKDQEEMILGDKTIKAILTPGHTPGSLCFLLNDDILFTGDNLALLDGKVVRFVEKYNKDTELQEESIKNVVAQLDNIKYLCTAHSGYTDNAYSALQKWR